MISQKLYNKIHIIFRFIILIKLMFLFDKIIKKKIYLCKNYMFFSLEMSFYFFNKIIFIFFIILFRLIGFIFFNDKQ